MVNKWELAGKINSSDYRKRVLLSLKEGNKTPTQLSKSLDIKMSHISRALKELENMNLIKCLTPELRKSKMYEITKLGRNCIPLLDEYK